MQHSKNCCDNAVLLRIRIFFLALTFLVVQGSASASPVFTVDPGTSTTAASVTVADNGAERWTAFAWKLVNGRQDALLTSSSKASTEPLSFELPAVEEDTYVEVGVTSGSDSTSPMAFMWRTLDRPKDSPLKSYTGAKELALPEDFTAYWDRAIAQLDAVTSNPKMTRVADRDTTTGLLYRVELDSVENTTLVGWLFVPRAAYAGGNPDGPVVKKFPAILLFPGYNGDQQPVDRTAQGYVTFSFNPRNHGPSRAFWKSPVEHLLYNITTPESYFYKLAALDCLQASRYLFTRPEIDPARVGAEGSSQGGYLSMAAAALDPRISCVTAIVIAFSDYPDGLQLASRGGMAQLRDLLADEKSSPTLIRQSLAYTDGANLATRVKAKTLVIMGGIDPVAHYICGLVTVSRLHKKAHGEFRIDASAPHKVTATMRRWTAEWEKQWLKPEPVVPGS